MNKIYDLLDPASELGSVRSKLVRTFRECSEPVKPLNKLKACVIHQEVLSRPGCVKRVMDRIGEVRRTSKTLKNSASSRTHALLSLEVYEYIKPKSKGKGREEEGDEVPLAIFDIYGEP